MAGKSKYTDEQRHIALDIYTNQGLAAANRHTDVPKSTITSWAKQAGIFVRDGSKAREQTEAASGRRQMAWAERRAELVTKFGSLADLLIDKTRVAADAGDLKEARYGALGAAIAVDKAQLLSGGVTDRVDFGSLPADERAAKLVAVRDELQAQRDAKAAKRAVGQ